MRFVTRIAITAAASTALLAGSTATAFASTTTAHHATRKHHGPTACQKAEAALTDEEIEGGAREIAAAEVGAEGEGVTLGAVTIPDAAFELSVALFDGGDLLVHENAVTKACHLPSVKQRAKELPAPFRHLKTVQNNLGGDS